MTFLRYLKHSRTTSITCFAKRTALAVDSYSLNPSSPRFLITYGWPGGGKGWAGFAIHRIGDARAVCATQCSLPS